MMELLDNVFVLMVDVQTMRDFKTGPERKTWVIHRANAMLETSRYKDTCSIEMLDAFIEFVFLLATENKEMLHVFRKSCCLNFVHK